MSDSDTKAPVADSEHRVGDVWHDLDPRRQNRDLKVIDLTFLNDGLYAMVEPVDGGRATYIRVANLRESRTGKSGFHYLGHQGAIHRDQGATHRDTDLSARASQ
jgi:hypothetical protein